MNEPETEGQGAEVVDVPRCLDCAYCLLGLPEPRCPECARPFDLADPSSFSTRPPLIRWRLWLPGLLLAMGLGVGVFSVLLLTDWGIGWAATGATPICVGAVLGYRCRVQALAYVLLALSALTGILVALLSLDLTGLICSLVAFCVLFGPMLAGALMGKLLRWRLKASGFDQRSYLPVLLMFFLPLFLALAENHLGIDSVRTSVQTSRVLQVSTASTWQNIRYFEQIEGELPLLFRLGGLEPLGTDGTLTKTEDVQTCHYRNGSVTKTLRTREAGRTIEFDVVEQDIGFERSVRLLGGSFGLEPLGATKTRLTLRTDFEALLRPRECWAPFENYILHILHDYILDGIEQQALAGAYVHQPSWQISHDSR